MSTLTIDRLATLPRVNLLPPEIEEQRRFRKVQIGLGAGVVAAVGVVGALTLLASGAVGDAQHRLGQAHQGDALARGQTVFGQKMLHQAGPRLGPDAADQIGGAGADGGPLRGRQRGLRGQAFQKAGFVRELGLGGKEAGADRGHADLLAVTEKIYHGARSRCA